MASEPRILSVHRVTGTWWCPTCATWLTVSEALGSWSLGHERTKGHEHPVVYIPPSANLPPGTFEER